MSTLGLTGIGSIQDSVGQAGRPAAGEATGTVPAVGTSYVGARLGNSALKRDLEGRQ